MRGQVGEAGGKGRVATVETRYEHIVLRGGKVPVIFGTRMKVVDLVTSQRVHGYSAAELAYQYPHLTLG